MRIILADIASHNDKGKSIGHYFHVAKNYMDIFSDNPNFFLAGGPLYRDKFSSRLIQLPHDHHLEENGMKEKYHELMNCRYLFRHTKGDTIILQTGARLTTFIAILLFYWKTSSLYLIQYNTESIKSKFGGFIWSLIKYRIKGIICSSDRVGKAFKRPYIVVTDYIYTQKGELETLDCESRRFDYCFIGSITKDKGQVEALRYLSNKGHKIVIAGKICEEGLREEIEEIHSKDPTIDLRLGFVSEDDYYFLIRNSKYCVLNYRGTYNDRSSGVVLDILFMGTPILGNESGALGIVKNSATGFIYSDLNKVDSHALLDEAIYAKYISNIRLYLKLQADYILKLKEFVKTESL